MTDTIGTSAMNRKRNELITMLNIGVIPTE